MTAPLDLDAIRARAEAAAEHVGRLATKEDRWRMSVPVREDDSDVLLMEVADQDVPALLAEVARLRADRDKQGRFLSVVAEFARTTGMSHREVMEAVGVKADADRLAAVVERVREVADKAPKLMHKRGEVPGIVSVAALRAAIERADS